MKKKSYSSVRVLRYLLSVHIGALVLMSLFRRCFLWAMSPQLEGESTSRWPAMARGLWFDNVVACYVMLPALVVAIVALLLRRVGRGLRRTADWYFGIMYGLIFMACAANIPYFSYFSRTLNSSIWQWFAYPAQTAGMLFGEAAWLKYILLYVCTCVLFVALLRFLTCKEALPQNEQPLKTWPFWVLVALLPLCVFGARGRMGYNPIKVSAAYYCEHTVLNQMGVNAAFNLLQTTLDDMRPENRTLHLMDGDEAVGNVQAFLGRSGIEGISPLAREVHPEGVPTRQNVVVVLMESMSAKLMTRFGGEGTLTPVLDSLYAHGLSFANCYSAGNHTNHGLYATLYGFPSILKRNAMKGSSIPTYSGLPTVLRDAGYRTLFFMTHEAQYDNMNAFLRTNGYEEIFSQENYPRDKRANHFGVPDDYLFSYALSVLNERAKEGKPFFATLLTISNHPPYVIQPYFHPRSQKVGQQIVEYADWAVGRFMAEAAKQPWFDSTIFVFLGDHGMKLGETQYEVAESFNHIPLIFYGKHIPAEERGDFCGQVDVAPTILGMLCEPYVQNNFGIDLVREKRHAAFYSADNVVCARDSLHLFVYNPEVGREFLYDVSTSAFRPEQQLTPAYEALRTYVFSNLQAAETLVQRGQTRSER